MEQVQHRQRIPVLIIVQHETNLVEENLCLGFGQLLRMLLAHDYARFAGDWFEDVLMRSGNVSGRNLGGGGLRSAKVVTIGLLSLSRNTPLT
jgi:hypothetical protein